MSVRNHAFLFSSPFPIALVRPARSALLRWDHPWVPILPMLFRPLPSITPVGAFDLIDPQAGFIVSDPPPARTARFDISAPPKRANRTCPETLLAGLHFPESPLPLPTTILSPVLLRSLPKIIGLANVSIPVRFVCLFVLPAIHFLRGQQRPGLRWSQVVMQESFFANSNVI
jgi:hypothetical protein